MSGKLRNKIVGVSLIVVGIVALCMCAILYVIQKYLDHWIRIAIQLILLLFGAICITVGFEIYRETSLPQDKRKQEKHKDEEKISEPDKAEVPRFLRSKNYTSHKQEEK